MSGLRPFTSGVYENDNDWRRVIPEDLPLTTDIPQSGLLRCAARARFIMNHSGGGPSGMITWKVRAAIREPKGDKGVGGIKFAPLNCKDEDLREWKIVSYGIDRLREKRDKPLVSRGWLAQAAHAVERPSAEYYDMHPLDRNSELPPYREDDLAGLCPRPVCGWPNRKATTPTF